MYEMEPMAPPAELDRLPARGLREPGELSRRAVLRIATGFAGAAALTALGAEAAVTAAVDVDNLLPDILYPGTATTIQTLNETAPVNALPFAEQRLLLIGGFGEYGDQVRREAIDLAAGPYVQDAVSYVDFAPQGIVDKQLADQLALWAQKGESLDIVTVSMGWVSLCRSLLELRRQGMLTRAMSQNGASTHAIPLIRSVALISSPANILDVWYGDQIKRAYDSLGFAPSGDIGEKWLLRLIDQIAEHHVGFEQAANAASGSMFDPLSPRLCASQIRQLMETNTLGHCNELRDYFKGTQFIYAHAANASDDGVVNVRRAMESFDIFATGVGGSLEVCGIPRVGHADVARTCSNQRFGSLVLKAIAP